MIRRLSAVIMGVLIIVVSSTWGTESSRAQNAPSRPLDTDINDYVVFGATTVDIKGSNDPDKGFVRGGNIGANGVAGPNEATVNICANADLKMSEHSQVVGDVVRFSRECQFWDLFANRLVGEGGGITNSIQMPVGDFPLVALPPFPSFACTPGNDITVRQGDPPFTLPPGNYGDVRFQDGTTATLLPGLYTMCNFRTGQNVHTITQQGTVMQVVGEFDMRNGNTFGVESACGTYVYIAAEGLGANAGSLFFGRQTTAAGHFYSQGRINLGNNTILYGTFWGNQILSDFGINIEYCPPIGEFPITKAITGSGAGLQDEIRFEITCTPNPPNTTPIPPFVIPAGATGPQSTIVTGITLPATCLVQEVFTGANANVDVVVVGPPEGPATPRGAPAVAPLQVPLCPDFGVRNPEPVTGEPRDLPGFDFIDIVEPTSTTSTSTSTTSTTSTSTTSTTLPAGSTTTSTTSTTTSSTSSTSVVPTLAPTTTIACVLPPVTTIGPETTTTVDPGGATLPATGRSGSNANVAIAAIALALGVALILVTRRRPT